MTAEQRVSPQQLRTHASNLEVISALLGEVRNAGQEIGQSQSAFGPLCGWILTGLGDRYTRNQELLAYVQDSLVLIVQGLHRVADGNDNLARLVFGDDVAAESEPAAVDEPDLFLREQTDNLIDYVKDREWVVPQLAGATPVAEFAAPVSDGYAALRAGGLQCAVTYVDPLRRLLRELTGTPEIVARQAAVWNNMAVDLRQLTALLRDCLDRDVPHRDQMDVRSYLALMAYNVRALSGLAETARSMAVITKAAGDLILLSRDIIRGVIGDLFARVIVWVTDTPAVISLEVMTIRLGTVIAACWRIDAYMTALTASIIDLSEVIDG